MNRYLMSYDVSGPIPDQTITAFVKANRFVDQWSFLFGGAYLLKSKHDLITVDNTFTNFFKPTRYIIVQIDHSHHKTNGWISQEVWKWLDEEVPDIAKLNDGSHRDA